jgi:hypothetical protein
MDYVYSDFNIKLKKQADGDIQKDIDFAAVKNSIVNILSTTPGERRMNPNFGSSLTRYLFEPVNDITANKIGNEIFDSITRYDDRVVLNKVHVHSNHDKNQYEIVIDYSIGMNTERNETISFVLKPI